MARAPLFLASRRPAVQLLSSLLSPGPPPSLTVIPPLCPGPSPSSSSACRTHADEPVPHSPRAPSLSITPREHPLDPAHSADNLPPTLSSWNVLAVLARAVHHRAPWIAHLQAMPCHETLSPQLPSLPIDYGSQKPHRLPSKSPESNPPPPRPPPSRTSRSGPPSGKPKGASRFPHLRGLPRIFLVSW